MNTIYNVAYAANDLIEELGQKLAENPMIIVGVAVFSFASAILAGYIL